MKEFYQTNEYKLALNNSGSQIIGITKDFLAWEREIDLPIIGRKTILESRGSPSSKILSKFREKSRDYYYGTIFGMVGGKEDAKHLKSGYYKVSNYTVLIDLNPDIDVIFKKLEKKSMRWGVNAAERKGLKFEVLKTKDELNKFYGLYKSTASEGKFRPHQIKFFDALKNTDYSKLFLVYYGNEIVAGGLIFLDIKNKGSILEATAASDEGLKLQAMPYLYWNLIKYSKARGLSNFDMGGYDMEAKKGDKMYNINKFKSRFGGKIVEQPIYSTNWKYPLFRKILKVIKLIKK